MRMTSRSRDSSSAYGRIVSNELMTNELVSIVSGSARGISFVGGASGVSQDVRDVLSDSKSATSFASSFSAWVTLQLQTFTTSRSQNYDALFRELHHVVSPKLVA